MAFWDRSQLGEVSAASEPGGHRGLRRVSLTLPPQADSRAKDGERGLRGPVSPPTAGPAGRGTLSVTSAPPPNPSSMSPHTDGVPTVM